MAQLRLAYVNCKLVSTSSKASSRRSKAFSRNSPESLEIASWYDRLFAAHPGRAQVVRNLLSNMVDEAEGRKL